MQVSAKFYLSRGCYVVVSMHLNMHHRRRRPRRRRRRRYRHRYRRRIAHTL